MAKLVFAHYFTPYPISFDNAKPKALGGSGDYYDNGYLSPTGEGGAHAAYGGLLRDRPAPRNPLPSGVDFWQEDINTEVKQAMAAGLDGFTVDLLSYNTSTNPSVNSNRHAALVVKLLTAARATGFKIVLMPDMNAVGNQTPAALAQMLKVYSDLGAYKLPDGRLVVSPFLAEKWAPGTWTQCFTALKTLGGPDVAFVPCFLNFQSNYQAFASICYGFSNWGNRTPASNTLSANTWYASTSHALGKIWMQPVSLQDSRPNQYTYWEAANTLNFRQTWAAAITAADWVQIPTWNDYSENTHIAPSAGHGTAYSDLNAYYAQWFKTGLQPVVAKDKIYITHRKHWAGDKPTYPETKLMGLNQYSQAAQDQIEVLVFATDAATLDIAVDGVNSITNYAIKAGINVVTVPLAAGHITANLKRGVATAGSTVLPAVSPTVPTHAPYVQDLRYIPATS